MERDRECRLLLNDLNDILSEQCLEQRVRCRYLNDPVQELAECINQLLDICERAVTMTLDITFDKGKAWTLFMMGVAVILTGLTLIEALVKTSKILKKENVGKRK